MSAPFTKLSRNVLNCLPSMRNSMDDFYVNKIGMECLVQNKDVSMYSFPHSSDCNLELRFRDTFESTENYSRSNAYWKIGLGGPDVNVARDSLMSNGIEVAKPGQFMDIGYLCDLYDPSGFNIELLQHSFQSNFDGNKIDDLMNTDKYKLGSNEVSVTNITLRVSDIKKSLFFYETIMGMTYLSKQPVEKYGFTLYFFDFPPSFLELIVISSKHSY